MTAGPATLALPQGRIEGRVAFQDAVRNGLRAAQEQGWPELVLVDADFADWRLGEAATVELLQGWSRPGRRITLLAASYARLETGHPRLLQWRRQWDAIVSCRRSHAAVSDLPSAFWSPDWVMRRVDAARCVAVCGREPERRLGLREAIEGHLLRSSSAFPASILGL
ncbi:hypothetical protein AAFF27_10720 [Xylophilus sp. GW821-FHT01B05]